MTLTASLYSVAQLRELDRRAIEQHGIPASELMTRAATVALRALRLRFPRARRLAVVCGSGNNGGDGYVLARLARAAGLGVSLIAVGKRAVKGAAANARLECEAAGIRVQTFDIGAVSDADVVVDALLGLGLERDIAGEYRVAIDAINAGNRPVVALDIPSGLQPDTGAILGAAIRAHLTISFIGLKPGFYTAGGRDCVGEVLFDDLDIPPSVYQGVSPVAYRLERDTLRPLPVRRHDSHKGSFGHVAVIGGAPSMLGAARLCGEAAYRTGAGLVTLATHPSHAAIASVGCPELLAVGARSPAQLKPLLAAATVAVLGPGLARNAWARSLYSATLKSKLPLVVDADALNMLAARPQQKKNWILTPHPGEAARLLGATTATVQRNRFDAVRALVKRYGGVCVLKGAGTLIAARGEKTVALCDHGNPGMASGGMGDVLGGMIGALYAQGLDAFDAACLGVWLHASAGDIAVGDAGIGLVASDLLPQVRRLLDTVVTNVSDNA